MASHVLPKNTHIEEIVCIEPVRTVTDVFVSRPSEMDVIGAR